MKLTSVYRRYIHLRGNVSDMIKKNYKTIIQRDRLTATRNVALEEVWLLVEMS